MNDLKIEVVDDRVNRFLPTDAVHLNKMPEGNPSIDRCT